MFTLEVAGKAIAVTDASEEDARELLESDAFKADMMEAESDGAPMWDGFATMSIRPATRAEIAAFESTPMAEGKSTRRCRCSCFSSTLMSRMRVSSTQRLPASVRPGTDPAKAE